MVFAAAALVSSPAKAQDTAKILMLGDSLTAGYGLNAEDTIPARLQAALDAAGAEAHIINGGVSGDTTKGGLARLDWLMADGAPDVLFVALGGNDGLRALDPAQTRTNLAAIIEKGQSAGALVVLVGMLAPPNLGRAYESEFNAVFPELAKAHGLMFFDPFLLKDIAGNLALNQADGIHPNAAGAEAAAQRLAPILLKALAEAGKRR
ncbi:MAG: arylesterase [Rhodospirillales bacterium]